MTGANTRPMTITGFHGRNAARTTTDGATRVERRIGLPSGRAALGGLLMALAAIGVYLAHASATADDTIAVAIAARDLRPGETITAADLELVDVELPGPVRGLFGSVDAAVGRQVGSPVDRGEFLLASATVEPTHDEALELAITLPSHRAAGRLRPGDRVDVFSTWSSSTTELIAVDARVLEVRGAEASVIGGSDVVTVRLAVEDFAQVEALVHAQAAGDLTLVRATIGTERHDVGRRYQPAAR